jgi:hypothetical protein
MYLLAKIESDKSVRAKRDVGFFWVVQDENFKLNSALRDLMCQFVVFQKPNEVTSAQKKRQNDSVEFTKTYASKNNMSYFEANKSEDRKMKYKEYKKHKEKD